MKKSLILFSVAALALVSCAKVQDTYVGAPEAREIGFSPLAQTATKSGAQSGTFPNTYNMYVAAYQTSPNTVDYFGETEFVNFETNHWHGSSSRYWPLAISTINFLAVTAGPGSTSRAWGEGTPLANYAKKVVVTMDDNQPDGSGVQHDLMWAVGQGSVTQASAGAALTFPTEVSMEFQHALALVKFTEKVTSTASGNIKLTSITLNDAYYEGTLTVTNTNFATTPTTGSTTHVWDVAGVTDVDAVTVPGWTGASTTTALTNTADFAAVGDGLMIVPPTSTAAFSGFTVTYQIKRPDSDNWDNYTYTYTPTSPDGRVLNQGYQYTYNITFNLNEIVIYPTVATWNNGTGQSITIQ